MLMCVNVSTEQEQIREGIRNVLTDKYGSCQLPAMLSQHERDFKGCTRCNYFSGNMPGNNVCFLRPLRDRVK